MSNSFSFNDDIGKFFGEKNIIGWKRDYSDMNLLIAENGSGKSRFLQAVRDYYVENKKPCLYFDFASLSPVFKKMEDDKDCVDLCGSIAQRLTLSLECCSNIMNCIQIDSSLFFDILHEDLKPTNKGKVRKKHATELLGVLNNHLKKILKREIVVGEQGCYLPRKGERDPLEAVKALAEMSPGERNIIYFALGVLYCAIHDDKPILLIDEPETHLHPEALLSIMELIVEIKKLFQCVFIASHSIFLLPKFEFEQIVYLDTGSVKRSNSSMYDSICKSLLGANAEDAKDLYSFLASISEWQFKNFLAECLLFPEVVSKTNSKDEQVCKLKNKIAEMLKAGKSKTISLLDYGAGTGRLAHCLHEIFRENTDAIKSEKMSYTYYDQYSPPNLKLPEEPWVNTTRFTKKEDILKSENFYDIVVLFNVLHEISVDRWEEDLNIAMTLLSEDGFLLFSEKWTLSRGEAPYGKSGYILLGIEEIKLLFKHFPVEGVPSAKEDKALYCIVKKTKNAQVTKNSIAEALKKLLENTRKNLDEFWSEEKAESEKNQYSGKNYAFYCQQYFNALRALEIIGQRTSEAISVPSSKNLQGASKTEAQSGKAFKYNLAQYNLLIECSKQRDINAWNSRRTAYPEEKVNLVGANLKRAYLGLANLERANLEGTDLGLANLVGAYLVEANLGGAYLVGAYLVEANLAGADLEGADLEGAYLEGANLRGANLRGVNLKGVNLKGVNLEGVNLEGVKLEGVKLRGTILDKGLR